MNRLALAALVATLLGCAQAPVPPAGPVSVSFADSGRYSASARALPELKRYLEIAAARHIAPGQKLDIVLTSLDRAGRPSLRGQDSGMRIVDDTMPARIDLQFVLTDAAGAKLAEGQRSLRSAAYFTGAPGSTDPLRYEKGLLDEWLAKEFGAARS